MGSSVSLGTSGDPGMFQGTLTQLSGVGGSLSLVGASGVQGVLEVQTARCRADPGRVVETAAVSVRESRDRQDARAS